MAERSRAEHTSKQEQMESWSVDEVTKFFTAHDLRGPAAVLAANGVRGRDLVNLRLEDFQNDMRLSAFAARRLVAAREGFLS